MTDARPVRRAELAGSLKDEIRLHRRIVVPIAMTFLVELGMWYTDAIIVGRLGSIPLAAVGLLGGLFWEFMFVGFGLMSITGVFIGNGYGAGDSDMIRKAFRHGLWLATLYAVPVAVLDWYLADLLSLTGQDPEVLAEGRAYLHAMVFGLAPALWFTVMRFLVTALSRPLIVTVIMAVMLPVNAGLTWWFVFGGWGLEPMGVAGAGWATAITTWLSLIALGLWIAVWRDFRVYRPYGDFLQMDKGMWRQIFRLGVPVAIVRLIDGSSYQLSRILMGLFGASALAAQHVVMSMAALSTTLVVAVGHTSIVRVSQELGGRQPDGARRAGWVAIALGFCCALPVALLLLIWPDAAAYVFLDVSDPANDETMKLIAVLASVAAPLVLLEAFHIVASRSLRGRRDTWVPMWISALGAWCVALPVAVVLAFALDAGPAGLLWGLAAGFAVSGSLLVRRWAAGPSGELTVQPSRR
jgi:MATE family multidrug resistance protein